MQLSFRSTKSPDVIFDYLTNMQKFVSVHPVIFQIDKTGEDSYLVHEKLKFCFIPFLFTYPVTIEIGNLNRVVIFRATVMKLTKIEMKFNLMIENDETIVEENITLKSPLPVKFIMKLIFRKQHRQLFKSIEMK